MKGFLWHSGIEGMQWGVRRYQNPDGTLTEEGKIRYAKLREERMNLGNKYNKASKASRRAKKIAGASAVSSIAVSIGAGSAAGAKSGIATFIAGSLVTIPSAIISAGKKKSADKYLNRLIANGVEFENDFGEYIDAGGNFLGSAYKDDD